MLVFVFFFDGNYDVREKNEHAVGIRKEGTGREARG